MEASPPNTKITSSPGGHFWSVVWLLSADDLPCLFLEGYWEDFWFMGRGKGILRFGTTKIAWTNGRLQHTQGYPPLYPIKCLVTGSFELAFPSLGFLSFVGCVWSEMEVRDGAVVLRPWFQVLRMPPWSGHQWLFTAHLRSARKQRLKLVARPRLI